jgi:hypothetical protein
MRRRPTPGPPDADSPARRQLDLRQVAEVLRRAAIARRADADGRIVGAQPGRDRGGVHARRRTFSFRAMVVGWRPLSDQVLALTLDAIDGGRARVDVVELAVVAADGVGGGVAVGHVQAQKARKGGLGILSRRSVAASSSRNSRAELRMCFPPGTPVASAPAPRRQPALTPGLGCPRLRSSRPAALEACPPDGATHRNMGPGAPRRLRGRTSPRGRPRWAAAGSYES